MTLDSIQSEAETIAMDDRIDSFLKGWLSYEEEKSFLAECKSNPILKERAYLTALLAKALK